MADYTIAVSWSGKDALADSDANKVISGDDFHTEFTTVQTAINSKADIASETFTGTPLAPTAAEGTNSTQIATTAFVRTEILGRVYPVGSIFTTVTAYANSAAVVAVIGGTTWVAFGAGKVLVGLDSGDTDFDTVEETGGAKAPASGSTTLTVAQMNHSHGIGNGVSNDDAYFTGRSWSGGAQGTSASHYIAGESGASTLSGSTLTSGNLGSTDPILNSPTGHTHTTSTVQPYITVYFWKRTA